MAGWAADWSWGTTATTQSGTVQAGSAALSVTHTSPWAGLYFHRPSGGAPVDTTGVSRLRFWLHGGSTGGQTLQVFARNGQGADGPSVRLATPAANTWTLVEVPWTSLGSPTSVSGVLFQDAGGNRATFFLDEVALVR